MKLLKPDIIIRTIHDSMSRQNPPKNIPFDYNKSELIDVIKTNSHKMEKILPAASLKLEKLDKIRAILFDVYGTLFISDSGDIGTARDAKDITCFNEALIAAKYSINKIDTGKKIKTLFTSEIKQAHQKSQKNKIEFPEVDILSIWSTVLNKLVEGNYISTLRDSTVIARVAVEFETRSNPVWPMNNVLELLTNLKNRNYILGIISNSQFYTPLLFPALLEKEPEDLGFAQNILIWSYLVGHAKPSDLLFKSALSSLESHFHVEPGEVLYVGNDMLNDILPAQKNGFKTVLFAGDARSLRLRDGDKRCKNIVPDVIVDDLMQIKELIE
ncbi:MAG: HAD family hydrolase [Spirochaetota bacterium]